MSANDRNRNESIEQRVQDLLSRMTLEEKINQMSVRMGSGEEPETAARLNNELQRQAIESSRHRIPMLLTRESSHGLAGMHLTSFPACIVMASTWDEELNYKIGRVIAKEARAQGVHQGLSPVLDITRDPRWGRMEEGLGEDALLCSRIGVAFIKGLQGDNLRDGIIATPKHLVGYGASEGGKDNDPISISERDLHETYLPPFEAAIKDGKAESVMICFGALNGVPCTLDKRIVTDILREWGFDGHVVDDCPGIAGLVGHRAAHDMDEAIALGVNAGIDRQFYDYIGLVPSQAAGQEMFEKALLKLVKEGKVSEARINDAAARVLRSKFKLGLFEDAIVDPTQAAVVVNNPEHAALAREVAAKGITLLKNDNNVLPLKPDVKTIAVIGPNAADGQLGDYSGTPKHIVSPLEGLQKAVGSSTKVVYEKGCEILPLASVAGRFSVRAHGNLKVDLDEEYEFSLESNDGARLIIDGKMLINDWNTGARRKRDAKVKLTKGDHKIAVEYFKGTRGLVTEGDAAEMNRNVLRLYWSSAKSPSRIIPTDAFSYRGELGKQQHGSGEGLMMDVFLGMNFQQAIPEQSRVVRDVNFDWGDHSPILAEAAASHEAESIARAAQAAKDADVAIVCVGETSHRGAQQVCGEHFDRADLGLTGAQAQLVEAVLATGTPTVLVLVNGRSLAIPALIAKSQAVLEAWYPGQEGGHALADILRGKTNPSGKLPASIPHSAGQLPVYYNRRPRMGWYIDEKSEPLFPFGFGLSYTTFEYSNLKISPERGDANGEFTVTCDVKNTGPRAGDEVVQLYTDDAICTFATPVKRLTDFKRISLNPGETKSVSFKLAAMQLALLDQNLQPRVEPGEFKIQVGGSSTTGPTGTLWIL
jgi:beta-glucosidase